MSKDKISDYSATANSNTDIGGINIDEGCAPSGINDAIRTLMKQLKDWQSGSQDVYIHPAGSASVPSITATGDTNTGLFFPAADTVGITTGGSERVRVDSSGNLGIGTSSPSSSLHITSTTPIITLTDSDTGANSTFSASSGEGSLFISADANNVSGNTSMRFLTDGSERMRIDSSGNLGLGVTPSAWDSTYKALQVGARSMFYGIGSEANMANNAYYNAGYKYVASSAAGLYTIDANVHKWYYAASGTAGAAITFTQAMTLDASGNLGVGTTSPSDKLQVNGSSVLFQNTSGTFDLKLYQTGRYDGRITVNSSGMEISQRQILPLLFLTSDTERARIDSSGNLLVGTTSANGRIAGQSSTATNGSYAFYLTNSATTTLFYVRGDGLVMTGSASSSPYNNTTASAANVYVDSSGFLLRSTSSIKYKTDVQDATHGLAEVMQLRPVTYKGKKDGDKVFGGLIAEEVHEAGLTEFVQYADDETPDALAYGNMVSLLVKAIQELNTKVESQAAEIAALKG